MGLGYDRFEQASLEFLSAVYFPDCNIADISRLHDAFRLVLYY